MTETETGQETRWSVVCDPIKGCDLDLLFDRTAKAIFAVGQDVAVEIAIQAIKTKKSTALLNGLSQSP